MHTTIVRLNDRARWSLPLFTALLLIAPSCASPSTIPSRSTPSLGVALVDPLSPDDAALLALERAPSVRAALARSQAAALRARAIALPPDPTIALSWGLPIGMGENPVTAGIMGELAWLFARDRLVISANAAREIAAEELLAVTSTTAAEARKLTRSLQFSRQAVVAAQALVDARRKIADADQALVTAGELSASEAIESMSQRETALAMEADMRLEAHEFERALASLLAVESVGVVTAELCDSSLLALSSRTMEVLEAERDRAMRASDLAELDSWFASGFDGEVGYERDMEGDAAVMLGTNIGLPIFRRGLEVQAAQAELRAADAALDEAIRLAQLDAEHSIDRVQRAHEAARAAEVAASGLERYAESVSAALAVGESSQREAQLARAMASERRIDAARRAMLEAAALAVLEARTRTAEPPSNARAQKEGGAS
ncbi:MAG: TolC family protein [Phycisphaerales bacterium]|nr:TolC family protein [Phycisphaerales bacterium]